MTAPPDPTQPAADPGEHAPGPQPVPAQSSPVPFADALLFWLKLGFISFGGPAGQIALMHEHLVERRRWISEKRFMHALNYCMLLPGPEAQQLATYLGWLMHRSAGGILAGLLFVLPSFILITLIAWGYMAYGHLPAVSGLMEGIKPAVVALVLVAGWRMGSRTLRQIRLGLIAIGAFVALHLGGLPFPLVIAAAALVGLIGGRITTPAEGPAASHPQSAAPRAATPQAATAPTHPPSAGGSAPDSAAQAGSAAPFARALIDDDTPAPAHARARPARLLAIAAAGLALWALGWLLCHRISASGTTLIDMAGFFTQAALVTFGGAYAVLPYVHQAAVEHYGWLTSAQMLDALALGETTPGPLIMIVAFVGFIGGWTQQIFGADSLPNAGLAAALVATYFTFLPSFIFILAGGPLVEATRNLPRLDATLAAITAAVVGVIASLAVVLARAVSVRPDGGVDPLALMAVALAWWLLARRKWPVITTLAVFGAAGVALRLTGLR
jgi:chromate transporter